MYVDIKYNNMKKVKLPSNLVKSIELYTEDHIWFKFDFALSL